MKFAYEAFDAEGQRVSNTIESNDVHDASERLRRQGLFVSDIRVSGSGTAGAPTGDVSKNHDKLPRGLSKHLAVFSREMSVLVSTGTPLVESLMALERQSKNDAWKAILHDVRMRVEEGLPLSDAMATHPKAFDAVSRSLVAAGESSGQLDTMLARLASLTRRQAQTQGSIAGAMVYPVLLSLIAMVVTIMMIVFVLPRFSGLFETLDTPLPITTKFLMTISNFLRAYWWGVIPAVGAAIAGLAYWMRTAHGKGVRDDLVLKLPQFGRIIRNFATARIARILGILLQAHVPMMEALTLTQQAMGNRNYNALVEKAQTMVTRGDTISNAFGSGDLIPGAVVEAIRNGEQTGRLGEVLVSVADYLDEENETVIKSLSSLIEPLIMLAMGAVVGFIAISMFLPLFDLTAAAGT